MNIRKTRSLLLSVITLAGLGLAACQSDKHTMVEPKPGTTVVCRECYDEITKVRRTYRGHYVNTQNVSTHVCTQCKTDMSIYTENGVLMVKCAGCAPQGMACDKCLPPYEK